MKIYYLPRFKKSLNRIPASIQAKAIKKEKIFKLNPEDPRLKTHPLKGKFSGKYAFSVDHQYRIMFVFQLDGSVAFIDIGTHSIYK